MYYFQYHKIRHMETFKVDYHQPGSRTYYVYYFYLIKEFRRTDDNLERLYDFIIEWSKINNSANEQIDHRATMNYGEYTEIKRLLMENQYDQVFKELDKLDNILVTKCDNVVHH